jgi:hypothetical protein
MFSKTALESSKQVNSTFRCNSFDVTNPDDDYEAHEILSKIRHKSIQNINLLVFLLYEKIITLQYNCCIEKSEMRDKYL